MAPLDLTRLAVGDRVQHELLVREREDKVTRDGESYVFLTLGNRTGNLAVPVWSKYESLVRGILPGKVVQVIGVIEQFKGRRQLRLTAPPRVVPAGAEHVDQFLPRVAQSAEQLWHEIDSIRSRLSGSMKTAVDSLFADDAFRVVFQEAPAGFGGRLAARGGLLLHSVEVAALAETGASLLGGPVDAALAAALLHDVGRAECFVPTLGGFETSERGQAIGPTGSTLILLENRFRAANLDMESPTAEVAFILRSARLMNDGAIVGDRRNRQFSMLDVMLGAEHISRYGGLSLSPAATPE